MAADVAKDGDAEVFFRIRSDFNAKSVQQSDHQIQRTMDEMMIKAVEQIRAAG